MFCPAKCASLDHPPQQKRPSWWGVWTVYVLVNGRRRSPNRCYEEAAINNACRKLVKLPQYKDCFHHELMTTMNLNNNYHHHAPLAECREEGLYFMSSQTTLKMQIKIWKLCCQITYLNFLSKLSCENWKKYKSFLFLHWYIYIFFINA